MSAYTDNVPRKGNDWCRTNLWIPTLSPSRVTSGNATCLYLPAPLYSFWSLVFQTLMQRTLLSYERFILPPFIMKYNHRDLKRMQFQEHNHGFLVGPLCFCKGQTCPEAFVNCQNSNLTTMQCQQRMFVFPQNSYS